jgi:hypothetical protein
VQDASAQLVSNLFISKPYSAAEIAATLRSLTGLA